MVAPIEWKEPVSGDTVGLYVATGRSKMADCGNSIVFEMMCACGSAKWLTKKGIFSGTAKLSLKYCKKCNPPPNGRERERIAAEKRKKKEADASMTANSVIEKISIVLYGSSIKDVFAANERMLSLTAKNSRKIKEEQ